MPEKPADKCEICGELATMSPCEACPIYLDNTDGCDSPKKNIRTCSKCGQIYLYRMRLGAVLIPILGVDFALDIAVKAIPVQLTPDNMN